MNIRGSWNIAPGCPALIDCQPGTSATHEPMLKK